MSRCLTHVILPLVAGSGKVRVKLVAKNKCLQADFVEPVLSLTKYYKQISLVVAPSLFLLFTVSY